MKVLEMTDAYYPSIDGVVNVVNNYAKELSKKSECIVCAPKPSKKDNYKEEPFFKVIRCASMKAPEKYRNALSVLDVSFNKKLIKEKPDIIHAHTPFLMGRTAIKLSKKLHVPLVATLHTQYHRDFERTLGKHNPLRKFMMRFIMRLYKKADSVWTVSEASKKFLRMYGYKGDIEVVRNATDFTYPDNPEELIEKVNSLYGLNGQNNVFLFVGRMSFYKNPKLLLDALSILKEKNIDYKMIFAGGGFDLEEIENYAKNKGVFDRCIFTGGIKDKEFLQALYLRCDLLIFPSTFDTSGIVLVEAAAHKKPSMVTKDSCPAEEIEDGVNGFTCEENVVAYANKILEVIKDDKKLKEVGINAYNTIYKTWDMRAEEVLSKYEEIIEKYQKEKNANGKNK